MNTSGWIDFNSDAVQKPIQQKKVFEYKRDNKRQERAYGSYNDPAADSSGEMDSYSVVPIPMPERNDRIFNAPQRKSKQKRSYNQSAVSKFSDQQIDSSKVNQEFLEPVNDTIDYGFNQEFQAEKKVDFSKKEDQMWEEAKEQPVDQFEEEE